MTEPAQYYSLLQLQELLRDLIAACPMSRDVWIVAELSDVNERGGHCYMELLQKDPATGQNLAKARATVWANNWRRIRAEFVQATGQPFAAGLKVMVRVSAGYHPLYGMNLNITEVNPSFTMGERQRRRREILERLQRDGVIDCNKRLSFPRPTQRIAVISSATAAGYGDFCNQLINNDRGLRFELKLFPAVVQGPQTARSVIAQLDLIAADADAWDCVCIIRGGGASTDLDGFDDYELAANVAQFPLPVIVGIGHERDTTVLDYIACQRVKTPTAAAEFILSMAMQELATLHSLASGLLQAVTDAVSGASQQLAYISGRLPVAPVNAVHRAEKRLASAVMALSRIASTRLSPLQNRLDRIADAISTASATRLKHAALKLDSFGALIDALSPKATLKRGFSITRLNGAAVTDASLLTDGAVVVTELAEGTVESIVKITK